MNTTNKTTQKSGITIVEAMVGITILAIGIAGASRLAATTSRLADLASDKQTAVQLAKNRIERMAHVPFAQLSQWAVEDMIIDSTGQPDLDGKFKLSTAITYPASTTNLAEIAIDVWTRNRNTRDFDLPPETINTYLSSM